MENQEFVLEMNHFSKSFPGVVALDDVTIKIRPGTVHALMGENGAGKSTLMKCLFGIYVADQGEVILNGEKVFFTCSRQALDKGISMIHQELHPVPYRNVMENLWLGRFPEKRILGIPFVDHKKMYDDTIELFKSLQLEVDPTIWVRYLSVSQIQMMEIAKASSYNAKVIIMDEPSSSLTDNEVEHLFVIINRLRAAGVAIIYISHKMEEILRISDEVSIMRDGKYVGTYKSAELTTDVIISKMVGRDLSNRFPPRSNVPGEDILTVENFTSAELNSFNNVSFNVRKGEILGIGGLVGAKRTELVESLFGLRPVESGTIKLNKKIVNIKNSIIAIKNKMGLLTEERRVTGIVPLLPVFENTLIASLAQYINRIGLLNMSKGSEAVQKGIDTLRIKTPSQKTLIRNLSGGNQQKVLIARWLLTEPDILILDEPTRGIDVGAKYEIYTIIADLAKQGKSIIMISSEMPELLGMSDRVMVMCAGRMSGILESKNATQEEVMRLATDFE